MRLFHGLQIGNELNLMNTTPASRAQPEGRLTLAEAFNQTFHGKYSFQDLVSLDIASEVERREYLGREIYAPTEKLKKFHRFLNSFVFDYSDVVDEVVHSYRKGKSPYTALSPHSESKFFYKTDINNFFDSFSFLQLKNYVENNISKSPIIDTKENTSLLLNAITYEGKLPVGFGTSPNITNGLLFYFDRELAEYCNGNGVVYTRYSDDIILSSPNKDILGSAGEVVGSALTKILGEEFSLNERKTKLTHTGNRIKILGLVITSSGKISIDSEAKKELEVFLHFYSTKSPNYKYYLEEKFDNNLSKVSGRLNYANSIDPEFVDKLRSKYGAFSVDIIMSGGE